MSDHASYTEITRRYLRKAIEAERAYAAAKERFAAITASYVDRLPADASGDTRFNAAHKASTDPRRKKAGDDAAWARDEATMYALLALLTEKVAASDLELHVELREL